MRFLALPQVFLVVLIVVIASPNSFCATRTWTGAGAGGFGTDFNDGLNWTGVGAILTTDDMVINVNQSVTITMSASVEVGSINASINSSLVLGVLEINANGNTLTVNNTATFDGTNLIFASDNVTRLNVGATGGGFLFKGTASFNPAGDGACQIIGPTASPGTIEFQGDVSFGSRVTSNNAGDEAFFLFDAPVSQAVTCGQTSGELLGASIEFGGSNSPTVTITGVGASRFNTYDGDLRIKAGTTVDVTSGGLDSKLGGAGSAFSLSTGAHLILRGAMKLPGENNGAFTTYASNSANIGSTISYLGDETELTTLFDYGNLILNNGNTNTLTGTTIIAGDLTNEATLDVTASNHELQIQGSWTNNGTFIPRSGTVVFNGASNQSVLTKDTFYSIDIANNGNVVDLNDTIFIDHQVEFSTAGCLDLNGEVLVINDWDDGDFATLDSNRLIINDGTGGILVEGVDVGDNVNFPLAINSGSEVTYARVDVVNNDVAATSFKACLCNYVNFEGDCSGGTTVVENGVNITWQITSVSTDADLTFYWDTRNELTGVDRDSLRMNHHNGSDWEFMGDACSGMEWKTGIYTFTGKATSFSPFGISNATTILPIKLLFFDAFSNDGVLSFNWATAIEINNDYFTVEQSTDGENFQEIGAVKGNGTVYDVSNYQWDYVDGHSRGEVYYRLKQTDFDGKSTYSDMIIPTNNSGESWTVYPNPVDLDQDILLRSHGVSGVDIEVIVRDASGQICFQNFFESEIDSRIVTLKGFAKDSGVYFVTVVSKENTVTEQILVR